MDFKQRDVVKETINIILKIMHNPLGVMKDFVYGITVIEYLICYKEVNLRFVFLVSMVR